MLVTDSENSVFVRKKFKHNQLVEKANVAK